MFGTNFKLKSFNRSARTLIVSLVGIAGPFGLRVNQ